MAALVAWIVGTIVGSESKDQPPPIGSSKPTQKNKKTNARKSPTKTLKPKRAEVVPSEAVPQKPVVDSPSHPSEEHLTFQKQNSESSITAKYLTVSVPETRRRSLDFDVLVDKLEQIQEKPERKEVITEASPEKETATLSTKQKNKGKSRKKSPRLEAETKASKETKLETTEGLAKVLSPTKEQKAVEKVHTSQQAHFTYKQEQAVHKEQILHQNKDISPPKSSIIDHYKTKSKQFTASDQTASTSQEIRKSVTKKVERKLSPVKSAFVLEEKTKKILQDFQKPDALPEKSKSVLKEKAKTVVQDLQEPLLPEKSTKILQDFQKPDALPEKSKSVLKEKAKTVVQDLQEPLLPEKSTKILQDFQKPDALPEKSKSVLKEKAKTVVQDLQEPLLPEKSTKILQDFQKSDALPEKSKSVLKEKAKTVVQDLQEPLLPEKSTKILQDFQKPDALPEKSKSVLKEKAKTVVQDLQEPLLPEKSTKILQDFQKPDASPEKSKLVLEKKAKTVVQDLQQPLSDILPEKSTKILQDLQKPVPVKVEKTKTTSQNSKQSVLTLSHQDINTEKSTSALAEKTKITVQASQKSVSALPQQVTNTEKPTMKTFIQVRVLTLNDNEHQESTIYRIEKNWILQFRLGPSLFGRKVSLYCNYPQTKDGRIMSFDRNRYYLVQWKQDEGCHNADDTALFAEIPVKIAGSFHYYFIYENATESGPQGSGFFLVDPVLKCGNNEELPLNCIQCQTVLSKCLGSLSSWENKLRVAKESGYNVIHFTPIQELGKSNSAYSLSGQLKLNHTFNDNNTKVSFEDIEKLTSKMRTEWKVLSICDIVLNHTANETDWLQDHPESTFNCLNCPYMRPSYLLDAALHQFSIDVKKGVFETWGIPNEVCTEEHLNAIRHAIFTKVLPDINLAEMFICNVNKLTSEFLDRARKVPPNTQNNIPDKKLKLIRDPMYRRLCATIDMDLALQIYNLYRSDTFDEDTRLRRCGEEFKSRLDQLNQEMVDELNIHVGAAVENSIAGMRYFRVQHDGPKIKEVSVKNPLVFRYFTDYEEPKSVKEHEEIMYGPNSRFLMAHNGWVMNADPMRNFADPDSNVYIRRELIAWGDSVKLRFGDKPEDSPFLWQHMKAYVELTAKIFDGVRLDNCHSTPIPVAEYLLDCARRVRPDLYVVAELFTNSDHTDNIFVNRLGITSLIREAMSAWDSHEEGRLVYRYGGDPVGAFFQPNVRPLVPSIAHALFLDLTHDNPSPVEKRSVFDLLPSAALVNMACCASGSNRGYDELVNHHIHVVDEDRQYTEWTNDDSLATQNPRYVSYKSGIISAKRAINDLHFKLGVDGFNQVYVDQIDPDIVAVTRHRPDTHQSVVLVAFTAFGHPSSDAAKYQRGIKPLRVEGVLDEIILEATLNHVSAEKYSHPKNFVKDGKWINGLSEYQVDIKQHIQIENSDALELGLSGNLNVTQLNFKNFKPGSVVAVKFSLQKNVQQSIHKLRDLMLSFSRGEIADLSDVVGRLNLADLNRALYRCDQEERDEGKGFGAYNIPSFGSLVYCGLQGFMSLLSTIRPSNDLGHPMCGNLRDGNWMIDYICQRLKLDGGTKELGQWIEKTSKPLNDIPRYLVPSYFDVLITGIYINLHEQSFNLMSNFVKNGSTFVKGLSLGSLQFAAVIKSAELPTLSPNLSPPKPPMIKNDQGKSIQACVTLSAGLPHFSTGYMRNWGRDTFIALRGLFILTGRFQDARYHILGYAACLRHGLIPNLLDGGRNSRFNCRDAVWWWLYCIKSYVEEAPKGIEILSDKVSRIFPTDDSPAVEPGVVDQPLYEVIQEALKIHFQGLAFRERNAGRQIDEHMKDGGFNNQIGVHPETGFVFGGNEWNCGTWMDKMGSSDKAGNRGKPATPRDGSAIELIGLSKAVVTWLDRLHQQKQYPYSGVERTNKSGTTVKWTFKEWAEKIKTSFEQYFWVNITPTEGEIRPDLINKRGIYKDTYGATQPWTDFQLRCNFPIAMVAAPELFNPKHAWRALQNAEKHLLGPLGIKTLDPDDWAYCGDYNNADDSANLKTANGFNYHQGPEWVWPVGFYLRAKLHFAAENGELARTIANTKIVLSKHFTELQTSIWRGLPELTNSNGSFCRDSSRTQAWSMSCILEVLHDLQTMESKQQPNIVN